MNPSNVPAQTINPTRPPATPRRIAIRKVVLLLGLLLTLTSWLFRDRVRSRILEQRTLSNNSPTSDLVEEMIEKCPDRHTAILSAWNTGKIVHRRMAIGEVKRIVGSSHLLPAELEPLVLAGASDPDASVREVALCILRLCRHPALEPLAAAQLHDCDPELRLLGLDYFKQMGAGIGVPTVAPLLEDSDPFVAIKGLKLLEKWTHQNFGVKLTEIAASVEGEKTGLRDLRADGLSKAKGVIDRAKAWWAEHGSEFSSTPHSLDTLLSEVREKVARTVKESGVNYTVLIDDDFRVGGRFNGGDVPSTVIIDGQGFIRRRFTGRRALPVLERMIVEAERPADALPQREN